MSAQRRTSHRPIRMKSNLVRNNRRKDNPEEFTSYSLRVPIDLARMIPEGQEFVAEFTDEGLLYRAVSPVEPEPTPVPAWLRHAT